MKPIDTRFCYSSVFIRIRMGLLLIGVFALAACESKSPDLPEPSPPTPEERLIAKGRDLFFNETFNGNGRTCSTCHRAEDNFTIGPEFISTLPANDSLFVAEFNPNLGENFEKPEFMRQFGLILENLDGFEDLENVFVLRGALPTLALRTSIESPEGPRLGWSGDGSRAGTLKSFAIGAVIQHFPKTLNRDQGVDFRFPTEDELAALEAFQLALGRQKDLQLPLSLKGAIAKQGQEIFLDDSLGKCNICHQNAGANARLGGQDVGNANFNTGVENLPGQTKGDVQVPPDDGFGDPGDGTFNTPPLVEAADTAPFFHNHVIDTLEGAVDFYNSDAFNNSPAGQVLASRDPNGVGIQLEENQVAAVSAFLRVINALENIRVSIELIEGAMGKRFAIFGDSDEQLRIANFEIEDAIMVLEESDLHPRAVTDLNSAYNLVKQVRGNAALKHLMGDAIDELKNARGNLVRA